MNTITKNESELQDWDQFDCIKRYNKNTIWENDYKNNVSYLNCHAIIMQILHKKKQINDFDKELLFLPINHSKVIEFVNNTETKYLSIQLITSRFVPTLDWSIPKSLNQQVYSTIDKYVNVTFKDFCQKIIKK